MERTLIDFHICNCLPFIHSHKPGIILPPATKVYDEILFITIQRS